MKNLKLYILSYLILSTLLSFTPAFAQTSGSPALPVYNPGVDQQIKQYLCTPLDSTNSSDAQGTNLYSCINKVYKFAIVLAAVVGVFFLVIAGYLYMSSGGSDESVSKAKDILTSTIASLVILMAGYILLKAINPDLIAFHTISPPGVTLPADAGLVSGGGTTGGTSGGTIGGTGGGGQANGTAQQLAAQILTSSNITLATVHPSGNSDSANAKQNIIDVSQGNNAQRSSYTDSGITGPGGTTPLNQYMLQGMLNISSQFNFRVSEIAGGVHSSSATDPHYIGNAFDVDQINGQAVNSTNSFYQSFESACAQAGAVQVLGPGDSGHSTHIHCGWATGPANES